MAWETGKLADSKLRSAKPTGSLQKLTDGRGLQFWVTPQGGRYWRLEYRFQGKRKLLALGTYPDVSAAKAREKADSARRLLADGIDPSEVKRKGKIAAKLRAEHSFASVARLLVAKKRKEGRAPVTIDKVEWILGKVETQLGKRAISEITTPEIIAAIHKEEEAGNLETARRMRTVIGEVFRYAIQKGIIAHDPVQATRGAVAVPARKHFRAILDPLQFGNMLNAIAGYAGRHVIVGSALQLMALLYPRPGELRQAKWDEFDLSKAEWNIPASRMKLRQPHTKALPRQAVAILERLATITGPNGYVFPANGRPNRPMSENTLNAALRRIGISSNEHVSHGFRASASTLLNASNTFSPDAIERSLAHQDKDAVRRAYARGDAMVERRKMAQWWADYLDALNSSNLTTDNVVAIGA